MKFYDPGTCIVILLKYTFEIIYGKVQYTMRFWIIWFVLINYVHVWRTTQTIQLDEIYLRLQTLYETSGDEK